jgi:hypothetical protein
VLLDGRLSGARNSRISQIDAAVEESTRRGRTARAMTLAERQRATGLRRDGNAD